MTVKIDLIWSRVSCKHLSIEANHNESIQLILVQKKYWLPTMLKGNVYLSHNTAGSTTLNNSYASKSGLIVLHFGQSLESIF